MEEKEITSVSEEKPAFSEKIKSYFKNLLDFSQIEKKTIIYIVVFLFFIHSTFRSLK